MAKQTIFVATDNKKAVEFIAAYFGDTRSIPTVIRSKTEISSIFSCHPDLLFFQGDWVDPKVAARLTQLKSEQPKLKCINIGGAYPDRFSWDVSLMVPIDEKEFRKAILGKMEFPSPIRLLIVDDELEIIEVVKDYFEVRDDPPFQVRTALNGLEGFKLIEKDPPHCLILDIKMPVRTGVELYRDLTRAGYQIPTVIFIDSTSADDILEIRKWGAPVFVEKGGPSSSMPDMLALVKKLVAFS